MNPHVLAHLEKARKELLDLGLRNSLLNYRARSNRIDVIDELSDQVYKMLVTDGKKMCFVPLPGEKIDKMDEDLFLSLSESDQDWSTIFAEDEEQDQQSTVGIAARYTDNKLQTRLASESLHARLLKIYRAARTFLEEQGVNTLYLAIGFLHWYDANSSEIVRKAPLILVPVELSRKSAKSRFWVKYSESELSINLSLAEKLKDILGVELPEINGEDLDVKNYFNAVSRSIESQTRWIIKSDEICLGFFSFGKFLMYKDLDLSKWPEDSTAHSNEVIDALLGVGFTEPSTDISPDDDQDPLPADISVHQVVDADSSQTAAIVAVQQGKSILIQGPPGTGKSQTITNLIADCLANGKTVLFVAEKMAALEVVKRRLDHIDLGDSILELHSHKTNKKALLGELHRTLDLGKPTLGKTKVDLTSLAQIEKRLDDYAGAINKPVSNSGFSPNYLIGKRRELIGSGSRNLELQIDKMSEWSWFDIQQKQALVRQYEAVLERFGIPEKHPFFGSRLGVLLPTDESSIERSLSEATQSLESLMATTAELSSRLHLSRPNCILDVDIYIRAAERAIEAPHLVGVRVNSAEWQVRRDDLKKLCDSGRKMFELKSGRDDLLIEESWAFDVLSIRHALINYTDKWWRFFSSEYRREKKRLAGLCVNGLPDGRHSLLPVVDDILEYQRNARIFEPLEGLGSTLYGAQWQGLSSDWDVLNGLANWIVLLYEEIGEGKIPDGLIAFLAGDPELRGLSGLVSRISKAIPNWQTNKEIVLEKLGMPSNFFGDLRFDEIVMKLGFLKENLSRLHEVTAYNNVVAELEDMGLSKLVELTASTTPGEVQLETAIELEWVEKLLKEAYNSRTALQRFDRSRHEQDIKEFCKLDTGQFLQNRAILAKKHWDLLPNFNAGEVGIIRREINRKRGHMPIRRLLGEAGRAIQQIKPVFMMSPLSIANFLQPGGHSFDVLIFDEASQIKPVDAFGAILRCKQVVVVGDDKQMPPTNFFDSLVGPTNDDDENIVADMESILGLFISQGCRQIMLKWHYRSQDESLIAVSNYEFYNNKLILFPAPGNHPTARGLQFLHLPNTAYERGTTRTNPREAQAIALEVMKHAKSRPTETLGVVAFSKVQRDAIEMQLELIRRKDESCENFFAHSHDEPFFTKNLENVQGDERDTIFISIGYGKTKEGYLAMDFGPVNRNGGERRLNVLISRAKQTCRVFANFESGDLDLNRSSQRGVAVLKTFLNYAKTRVLDVPDLGSDETDSPFEDSVILALRRLGYEVRSQIGSGGFKLDIGVVDVERPGSYILGIECDGATYHSAKWARDRDRLREEVLKRLGWRIHRIWSTDYFRDPEKEIRRVAEAIERAKISRGAPANKSDRNADEEFRVERSVKSPSVKDPTVASDYWMADISVSLGGKGLHELSMQRFAEYIEMVVDIEAPVHNEEVLRRIMEACGVNRAGSRIKTAYLSALNTAVRSRKSIKKIKGFLWPAGGAKIKVRDRTGLDNSARNLKMIAPEEIALAFETAVKRSHSIVGDELIAVVAKSFGLQRVTSNMKKSLKIHLRKLIEGEKLSIEGDLISSPN
ncbi:MAG: DUF3320 domain-containing protein [Proteobacteria bacterium]|nr:DUF3320 domain-containing protein [Pseudomonadota bacterium]